MGRLIHEHSTQEAIEEIIRQNEKIRDTWKHVYGWAPADAADLLAKSRLDRQVSLSHCLKLWLRDPEDAEADGNLILAWVNLGSLVEGTMKFFLSVYLHSYSKSPITKRGKPVDPDELELEGLRQFFDANSVWIDQCALSDWVRHIQQRRNAIHFYKDREIGTFTEFDEDLHRYLDFLFDLSGRIPWPE